MGSAKPTMKILVSVLKDSRLYVRMTNVEKIALLNRLLKEFPYQGNSKN